MYCTRRFCYVAALFLCTIFLSSCKVGRFFWYNFADIKDYKKFPSRPLKANPDSTFTFIIPEKETAPKYIDVGNGNVPFDKYMEDNNTVALLIIRNDTLLAERYYAGYDKQSIVPSFSMAKSIISMLIGGAIDDGLIQSVQEPVTHYIPELKKNGFDKVTIEHLLQMTSGLKFNEGYFNPFGEVATFYYGRQLRKSISKLKLKNEPGREFEYTSGSTQLLGLVLERAMKGKTITQYFQEKIWTPLEMEYDASWSLDKKKDGLEKTFCCINARARDFAKLGRLYLHKGNWNGKQVISKEWVRTSTHADTSNGGVWHYRYQWWLPTRNGDFMARGLLGQFIYVNPAKNLIIVRLGKNNGKADWKRVFISLVGAY